MNANTVASTIIAGNYTNDELNSIQEAIKYAKSRLGKNRIRSLMLGDSVYFTSTKTGRTVNGTVNKIAQKYVTVRTIEGLWKVPANMLNLIEEWTMSEALNTIMSIRWELDMPLLETLQYIETHREDFSEQELEAYHQVLQQFMDLVV